MAFEVDDKVCQIAEAYALDAVDLARKNFRVKLDWTDASIRQVESMLQTLHEQLAEAKPSDEQITQFAKMFGSYIGEVYRRHYGARWGIVTVGDGTIPGMSTDGSGLEFWPWGRVRNRLVNGPADNVWHYYSYLLEKGGGSRAPGGTLPGGAARSAPSPSLTWWQRLTGRE